MTLEATHGDGQAGRIVVGVDGSVPSQSALAWAIRQARLTGAAVEAVTAWHYPTVYGYPVPTAPQTGASEIAERVLATTIAAVQQDHPGERVEITPRVIEGNTAGVLLNESAGADLLVIGSRGYGGFTEALLGSTGQHCIHHASCPVVVIRDSW